VTGSGGADNGVRATAAGRSIPDSMGSSGCPNPSGRPDPVARPIRARMVEW